MDNNYHIILKNTCVFHTETCKTMISSYCLSQNILLWWLVVKKSYTQIRINIISHEIYNVEQKDKFIRSTNRQEVRIDLYINKVPLCNHSEKWINAWNPLRHNYHVITKSNKLFSASYGFIAYPPTYITIFSSYVS